MFRPKTPHPLLMPLAIALLMASGCNDDDARVAQVAQEATQRQAAQNQEMVRLNREVAEGTRRLVQSRGEADQELLRQQRNLQQQRDELDEERRTIAGARLHESLLTAALMTIGQLLVCSLPLVLCWFLLGRLANETADTEINELLADRLVRECDPACLEDAPVDGLPHPSDGLAKLPMPGDR